MKGLGENPVSFRFPHAGNRSPRAPVESRYEELLERVAQALDSETVTAEDVEKLLARGRRRIPGRPTAATVLYALGSVVVFGGLAIAYGTIFGDLPWLAQITTPFVFPLAAFGVGVWLSRHAFARWQMDIAGLIGCVALAAAFVVVAAASGWVNTDREAFAFATVASALGAVAVVAQYRATGSRLLIALGLPAALAALGISTALLVGLVDSGTVGWMVLAEAAVAAATAALFARRDRRAFHDALVWATLGAYAAVFTGASNRDLSHFTVWHVILAAAVIAAFLAAGALDFDGLIWIGAIGGAVWMLMISVVVGSATSAALAVVLAGIGLVGLGLLVTRLRRGRQGTRA